MPHALNLGILYDKILIKLIVPDATYDDETLTSLAEKVTYQEEIKVKETEIAKINRK